MSTRRAAFADSRAIPLAEMVGGPTARWEPGFRLSSRFAFFADEHELLIACGDQEAQGDVDRALAYGLALAGDRDLLLVLPEGTATPTLRRLPWIDVPVRAWTHDGTTVEQQVVPARDEVLAGYSDPLRHGVHDLGDRAESVRRLLEWADRNEDLASAHRERYLAWHCAGRLVLRIQRTRQGLRVSGGVHAATGPPASFDTNGPLSSAQLHRVLAAAANAVADRLDGVDAGHGEKRLQALLLRHRRALRLVDLQRELPALRADGRRGFLDFLGVDGRDNLHVVEAKLGSDEMLVLQALDYLIWASAHADELAEHLGLAARPRVEIDLVVSGAADDPAIGPYSAGQLEALAGDVAWQVHELRDWQTSTGTLVSFGRRRAPAEAGALRRDEPRFAHRLEAQLQRWAGEEALRLQSRVFLPDADDGLVPAARAAFEGLRGRGLDHRMLRHVRSSQAFALNLFAPLDAASRVAVMDELGLACTDVEEAAFEFSDPADRLRERTPRSPHATQVDVLLRGRGVDGGTVVALVEVKLSERDFGVCSAYSAPGNDARDVCRTGGSFGDDPARCYQLRNKDGPHRRRYDRYLAPTGGPGGDAGCWWRLGANQPMRNVALGHLMIEEGEADRVVFALCAHDDNPTIWRRWQEAQELLDGSTPVRLVSLPASHVLLHHDGQTTDALRRRYWPAGTRPEPAGGRRPD